MKPWVWTASQKASLRQKALIIKTVRSDADLRKYFEILKWTFFRVVTLFGEVMHWRFDRFLSWKRIALMTKWRFGSYVSKWFQIDCDFTMRNSLLNIDSLGLMNISVPLHAISPRIFWNSLRRVSCPCRCLPVYNSAQD